MKENLEEIIEDIFAYCKVKYTCAHHEEYFDEHCWICERTEIINEERDKILKKIKEKYDHYI